MSTTIEFKYINPELYRHPQEKEARAKLEKIPGFNKALEMMPEGYMCKAERRTEIASMARVGTGVYGKLADAWTSVLRLFGLSGGVPLFVASDLQAPWSLRGGNENPALVLDVKCLDLLAEREMTALLGMQAGNIRLKNASYLAAADFLRWLSDFSGIVGAPAAMLAWGMEHWRRYAAFSSDRAAALAAGDPDAVVALLDRLAGAGSKAWGGISEPDQLRIQGIEASSLQQDWSNNMGTRFAMAMNRQNHAALVRRLDLTEWFASGVPAKIMTGQMTDPEPPPAPETKASAPGAASDDPGVAFWGEFASSAQDGSTGCQNARCPMMEVVGVAEKGWDSFLKAGNAFWRNFQGKK